MASGLSDQNEFPVKGLKILLVEDDEVSRSVLEKVLSLHGMEVKAVCNGEEAVDYFCDNCDIDLVLMDIQLPGIDGIETTKRIRHLQKESNLRSPVIAVTALASEWKRENFFPEGFDDYLEKPVNIQLLFDIILQQINHYSDNLIS